MKTATKLTSDPRSLNLRDLLFVFSLLTVFYMLVQLLFGANFRLLQRGPELGGGPFVQVDSFAPANLALLPPPACSLNALPELTLEWATDSLSYDIYSTSTPVAGDIDNDGVVEIITYNHNGLPPISAGPGNVLYVIDGRNGLVEDSIIMPVNGARCMNSGIALGDLDNDGFGEIVVVCENSNSGEIRCFEHDGTAKWTASFVDPWTPMPGIADFDQDGNPEVYASNHIFNGQTGALIGNGGPPPSGALGAPIRSGSLVPLGMSVAADVLPSSACPDCSGLELVCGDKVFAVNVGSNTMTVAAACVNAHDGFTAIADYDRDGDLDAVVSTDDASPGQTFVYVWDIQTSAVIATSPIFAYPNTWTIGRPSIGDIDGDGNPEIVVLTEDIVWALEDYTQSLAVKWQHVIVEESGFNCTALFDFQNDGMLEVISKGEDSLLVLRGSDGATISGIRCEGGSVQDQPIVADVDNDGEAEVVCGCSMPAVSNLNTRLHGSIVALGSGPNETWAGCSNTWNQASFFNVNVADSLQIPVQQQPHHVLADSIAYNGFSMTFAISQDIIAPVIVCPADTTVVNAPGLCAATVAFSPPQATDNCGTPTVAQIAGSGSGSSFPVGTNLLSFRASDAMNNMDSCGFLLTVLDTEPPSITCPSNVSVSNQPGLCGSTVNYPAPNVSDNCTAGTPAQYTGQSSGSFFNPGVHTQGFFVADSAGNTDSCSFLVTVVDTEPPTITCPANITVANQPGLCGSTVNYPAPNVTDNCIAGPPVQTIGQSSGSFFNLGANTQVFIAGDTSGNINSCTFTVTVLDTEPPTITCPANISTTNQPGQCGSTVNYPIPSVSDNCTAGAPAQYAGQVSGSFFSQGLHAQGYLVTDNAGNSDSCTFVIEVLNPRRLSLQPGGQALLCPGDSITISVNGGSATNWSNGATTPTITVSSPGTYFATGVDSFNCPTNSDSILVTTGTAPQVTTSPPDSATILFGSNIAVTGNGGNSYQWSNGDATATTLLDSAGTYFVIGYDTNGCRDTATFILNILCPALTADWTFSAANTSVTFMDQSLGNPVMWSWDFGDGNSSNLANPTHTYLSPGVYIVSLTIDDSCSISTATDTITVVCPAPVSAFSYTVQGFTVVFSDLSTGNPNQWSWTFGDGLSSNLQNPSHTYQQAGAFEICLKVINDCDTATLCDTLDILTGLTEPNRPEIKIYPNPSDEYCQIRCVSSYPEKASIQVYNAIGQVIYSMDSAEQANWDMRLDTGKLSAGTYFIRVQWASFPMEVKKVEVRH